MIGACVEMCGARLIVLPESFTTGFTPQGDEGGSECGV